MPQQRGAHRVARGQSGTLRVGFTENATWHGVAPDSLQRFRERQPDTELQLNPLMSLEQIEAVRSSRLDAGFVFNMPKTDRNWISLKSRGKVSHWLRPKDIL